MVIFVGSAYGRCPDCELGLGGGNGECGHCDGTGINTHLNSDQPDCPACGGSGKCATCGGSGRKLPDDDAPEIQTLFG